MRFNTTAVILFLFFQSCSDPNPPDNPQRYQSVTICNKVWMLKNLDVATYRNGDPIPKVTNPQDWENLTTGAYCYYNNDSATYASIYGKLYNWYAVNDSRGLAPEGWHIPTENEWKQLVQFLGFKYNSTYSAKTWDEVRAIEELTSVGPKLKAGRDWKKGKTNNSSGFSALPGGRNWNGRFNYIKRSGHWWSSTEANPTGAIAFKLNTGDGFDLDADYKTNGKSVRCLKD